MSPSAPVRTERYKYIRRYDGPRSPVLSNIDDGLTKSEWLAAGYGESEIAPERLYDTWLDPVERVNLVDSGAARACAGRICARGWNAGCVTPMTRCCSGPVPAPPEAELNDPDGLSPQGPMTMVGNS